VKLVKGAWKVLVGIKDFLVLVFMLLFFTLLFAVLSAKPNTAAIRDGALLVSLDGTLVEQPEEVDPFSKLSGGSTVKQQRLRDVVRALDAAKTDAHVKAVVLDLDRFMGGYPAAISEVAAAVGEVRKSGKPVLAYATAYTDDSYALAANASEIWVNPLGGAMFTGPGGTRLFYKSLLDKLGVNAHIYRVGKFKSAVEPYMRDDMSPEAKEAELAIYQPIWAQWQQEVAKARPKAKLADYLAKPAEVVAGAKGDIARSNLDLGIVDKLGDRMAFGKRVAEIAGVASGKPVGNFNRIKLADFVAAHPLPTGGDAIGVLTVAGEIVDGKGGPGTAAGDTISAALLKGLAEKKLKALVVRVDSPGGSALASEQIRQAIEQAKAQGLPVVVSMGSLAASGGYWVSTAGKVIFAEPNTITGSIGIFGVIPTFEKTLAKIGVGADGVRTTPLSGQPDLYGGTNEETDKLLQSAIEAGYARFIGLVAGARKLSPERVNEIAQGRVWIGGTAHQLGLVDRFGGINDAIAEAARQARLDPAKVHAVYLEKAPSAWAALIESFAGDGDREGDWADQPAGADMFARTAIAQRGLLIQAIGDARRLARGGSVQARCLECGGFGPATASLDDSRLFDAIATRLGL
jgi:protease IV